MIELIYRFHCDVCGRRSNVTPAASAVSPQASAVYEAQCRGWVVRMPPDKPTQTICPKCKTKGD